MTATKATIDRPTTSALRRLRVLFSARRERLGVPTACGDAVVTACSTQLGSSGSGARPDQESAGGRVGDGGNDLGGFGIEAEGTAPPVRRSRRLVDLVDLVDVLASSAALGGPRGDGAVRPIFCMSSATDSCSLGSSSRPGDRTRRRGGGGDRSLRDSRGRRWGVPRGPGLPARRDRDCARHPPVRPDLSASKKDTVARRRRNDTDRRPPGHQCAVEVSASPVSERSVAAVPAVRIALECGPVPPAPIGGRGVGGLQKLLQRGVGVRSGADRLVRQQELAEIRAVDACPGATG